MEIEEAAAASRSDQSSSSSRPPPPPLDLSEGVPEGVRRWCERRSKTMTEPRLCPAIEKSPLKNQKEQMVSLFNVILYQVYYIYRP